MAKVTKEEVDAFIQGSNPQERIIKIECGYKDDKATIFYRDQQGKKQAMTDPFYPFCWCKTDAAQRLFGGDRPKLRKKLADYGIQAIGCRTKNDEGFEPERMRNGYRVMFKAIKHMSFSKFMKFFEEGNVPIYPNEKHPEYNRRNFIVSSPVEQYMIYTGKRQFKGFNDYNELVRFVFDLETEGLDPHIHAISQIGCWTNKGFKRIIKVTGTGEERKKNELEAIREFFVIVHDIDPDVFTGHNIEGFDVPFFAVRINELCGQTLEEFTKPIFGYSIYKKKKRTVLKLGGEIEYFYSTIMRGVHVTDSLFAVRRAQAQDSNMKKADLKYATMYSKLNKENRVYVPGKLINKIWEDEGPNYAFNDENGDWYKYRPGHVEKVEFTRGLQDGKFKMYTHGYIKEGYKLVSGTYIVERYLLDDLYEADKVEHKFNNTNYFLSKLICVDYQKVYTMGTASIWKNIMLAWSYEHNLAIPKLIESHSFTGGLSRTMRTGMLATGKGTELEMREFGYLSGPEDKRKVYKIDLNSLYPAIILTYGVRTEVDIMDTLPSLLEYILTQREHYKGLKKKYYKLAEEEKEKLYGLTPGTDEYHKVFLQEKEYRANFYLFDSQQVTVKLIGNSYFGSFGSGNVFPWSDLVAAEKVTCIGRMVFRLMCYHFHNIHRVKAQWMNN